ncbi:MAG: tagaturonate reductase [Clostridia bacterium]|nr:tagaturonate reductase [Clostridia bacterium]
MVKILQYGEGNFLRTFVDAYFDALNKSGVGQYEVNIVKPITFGTLERFEKQNNKYHIVLRGVENGEAVENVFAIDSLAQVIDPFADPDAYYALAKDPDLKIIVSNTTEAGIYFNGNDSVDGFETVTYPAKLTKFLYTRFQAGLDGVYLMPVELIDNNADELKKCVDKYIELWDLPADFKAWNEEKNFYCNTLVDRIVSGYPRDEETKAHLLSLIGKQDDLMSIGEPFGLWAVENKGNISDYIKEGIHNIEVVLTNDIGYYKKRKVRVLNGSHTNLVPTALMLGAVTVYDCMQDDKLSAFIDRALKEEIIPFVSNDIAATTAFAESVKERFRNPYLNHLLTSISLNSISKWRARVLPSFRDYYEKYGKIAPNLTVGFTYLMAMYALLEKTDAGYEVQLPTRKITLQDDQPYLDYFAGKNSVRGFMQKTDVWGEDLTAYAGFAEAVESGMEKIYKGECLI